APSARCGDCPDQFESRIATQQILERKAHAAVGTIDGKFDLGRHGSGRAGTIWKDAAAKDSNIVTQGPFAASSRAKRECVCRACPGLDPGIANADADGARGAGAKGDTTQSSLVRLPAGKQTDSGSRLRRVRNDEVVVWLFRIRVP